MKLRHIAVPALAVAIASLAIAAEETNPIKQAMDFAHKAPKGEKKLNEKIVEGTASDEDVKKTLDLYKAMVDTKPPKGDQAAFKEKVEKLIAAPQELVDKKPDAVAHYKDAVNCKDCHSQFRQPPPPKPQ